MTYEILGWSEALTRFGDGRRIAHLVVASPESESGFAACGTRVRLSGLVEKDPWCDVKKCERCLRSRKWSTAAENVCEHGDHPAPAGKRFCSKGCEVCEHESESENGCDGLCQNREGRKRGKRSK